MRLIDADAMVEKAYWHGEHPDVGNPFAEGVEAVDMSDIDNAPTIEAEPVRHGRWVDEGVYVTTAYGYLTVYRCSSCDKEITIDDFDSYCPNCGAKMDGE